MPDLIAYLRVSTVEQADSGLGLEAQRHQLRSEAERRGWTLRFIEDAGFSGGSTNRPGLRLALQLLKSGEAEGLVVAKMDRLSRSLLDFSSILATAQKQHWKLHALDCPVDPSTPAGEAMISVMATFSQLERRLIGQRTKEALAVRSQQGVRLGRPSSMPTHVVRRIAEERESGFTFAKIADGLNHDAVATAHEAQKWHPPQSAPSCCPAMQRCTPCDAALAGARG